MTTPAPSDLDALIPKPVIYKMAGTELRQAPLAIHKLLAVVRYVESNYDVLEKFQQLGKPAEEGGLSIPQLLEGDLYPRLNGLLRLLLPGHETLLTDEWCTNFMTNAHYAAILKTALVQNQLYEVFTRARGFVVPALEAALRRKAPMEQPPTA